MLSRHHPARIIASAAVLAALICGNPLAQQSPLPPAPLSDEQKQALAAEIQQLWKEVQRVDKEGKWSEAVALGARMLAKEKQHLGEGHPDVAFDLDWLALRYEWMEDWPAANAAWTESLANKTARLGKDHWQVTDARLRLAHCEKLATLSEADRLRLVEAESTISKARQLDSQRKSREAVPLAKQAAAIYRELLGPQSRQYADIQLWTGFFYSNFDEYGAAERFYREAAEIYKTVLGEQHPEYARVLNNLGYLYDVKEDFARAEQCYKEALEIRRTALGEKHPDYAASLNNLAFLYDSRRDFAKAEAMYRQALEIRRVTLGEKHAWFALSLNNLAAVYTETGQFAKAEPLYRQALEVRREILSADDPDYAHSLQNLGGLYEKMADYGRALPLYQSALDAFKRAYGPRHPQVATSLNNLAFLYATLDDHDHAEPLFREAADIDLEKFGNQSPSYASAIVNLAGLYRRRGDFARAEPLYQQALSIRKAALGDGHEQYAQSLNNLGLLYKDMGDLARAEPLFRQAMEAARKARGENDPGYGQTVANLASVYSALGDFGRAKPLLLQAAESYRRAQGDRHPDYATALHNVAAVFADLGDFKEAEKNYLLALEIKRQTLGPSHPDVSVTLNNLAFLHEARGELDRAEPLYAEALTIRRQVLGDEHPLTARVLHNLSRLAYSRGDHARAADLGRQELAISRKNLSRAALVQSERQQLAMLADIRFQLDAFLCLAVKSPEYGPAAYDEVVAWKGMVLGRQRAIRALGERPEMAELLAKLRGTTARLATLSFARPTAERSKQQADEIAALSEQKEKLEGQLMVAARAAGIADRGVAKAEIQAALPAGAIFIDFLEFPFGRFESPGKPWKSEARLAAFVVPPKGEVQMLDLGQAEPIRAAIDAWRADFGATADGKKAAALLRDRLWLPIESRLQGATTVLISPDGALGKLPFGALPGIEPGSYLLERYSLSTIPSPQSLLIAAEPVAPGETEGNLLIVAGVDYNRGASPASPAVLPSHLDSRAAGENARFEPLPATLTESAAIEKLFADNLAGQKHTLLQAAAASQDAIVREAPQCRYLHLATHGYFAAPRFKSALSRSVVVSQGSESAFASNQSLSGYHPGLLSGLALAGANEPTDADDGILTAEEVSSLNLSGVDLAVLSACETGLGERAGGEGLIGLQRAFQVAGARTVIASLWSVPDEPTKLLMVRFYENLWKRKLPKGEALREAQLWMIRRGSEEPAVRRELVARGLDEVVAAPAATRRLPPYFWAAFVLSGDWQ